MTATHLSLPDALARAVEARLADWRASRGTRRLFEKDATLWTGDDEGRWLGWLDILETQRAVMPSLMARFAEETAAKGVRDIAVLGMGGSSLCPFVLASTFGPVPGRPRLHVLDSTDPSQIQEFEARLDLPRTFFVVSSKSGSTLEPNILCDYFLARVRERAGAAAGRQFVAITDPGSALDRRARADGFRDHFAGVPDIGGRFSALSNFGLVPAALSGCDVGRLLDRADAMRAECRREDAENPGVVLGIVMAEAAAMGIDKLTLLASPGITEIGVWLEQLIAESTGKFGKGIVPVAGEWPRSPEAYRKDRLFVHLRLSDETDTQDTAALSLARAGHPVIRLAVPSRYDLGAEFYRWEVATAVCGAQMGINPFNQPDVEASKIATRKLTDEVERGGALPAEEPFHSERGIKLYADPVNVQAISKLTIERSLEGYLRAHFSRLASGDYAAILAYLEMSDANLAPLLSIRKHIGDTAGAATTLGFGPRFLHSTGQLHKGGPNTGVFLQITCDEARDLPVPGHPYSFGTVKAAQARGDLAVLAERGRRAVRAHLGPDVEAGLRTLDAAIRHALT